MVLSGSCLLYMTAEEFKTRINNLFRNVDGKLSEQEVAKYFGVSIQDIRRFKKGKLPPRYRRVEIFDKLKRTWVHYEGQTGELPSLENN